MASEAQLTANRLNAQKSTGPRTVEGKAAVSLNAVQHGLRAQGVVLPGEGPDEYRLYRQGLLEDLQPQDSAETDLAERIVELAWRLRRAGRYHRAVFEALYEQQAGAPAGEAGEPTPGSGCSGGCCWRTSPGPGSWSGCDCTSGGSRVVWPGPGPRGTSATPGRRGQTEARASRLAGAGDASCPTKPMAEPVSGLKCQVPPSHSSIIPASPAQAGCTNQPHGTTPAAQKPAVNKQSQWQPPAVCGLDTAWTNKANFEDPIGILAARKRLPRRCAV